MAGPSATGNFAQAGVAAQRENERLLQATLENSPNYSKIVQEAAVRRGKEDIAAKKAEQKVRMAELDTYTALKTKKEVDDAQYDYKKSKAKAGKLAAAGGAIGGGIAMLAPSGRKKREVGAEDSFFQSKIDKDRADAKEFRNQAAAIDTSGKMPGITPVGEEAAQQPGGTADPASPKPGSTPPPASPNPGGNVSKKFVYDGLVKRGMSPENAKIGSAIMMGESGGNPGIDTVQSGLDTSKSNEYSIGLMQINTQAHADKLKRRGLTNDDLRNPEHNLDLTVDVFNEAGGSWKPWGAFTNGSYQQHMY